MEKKLLTQILKQQIDIIDNAKVNIVRMLPQFKETFSEAQAKTLLNHADYLGFTSKQLYEIYCDLLDI